MRELQRKNSDKNIQLSPNAQHYISKLGNVLRKDNRLVPTDLKTIQDYRLNFERVTENKKRREGVRNAIKFAYNMYEKYAMGHDELQPISRSYKDWVPGGLAMTIVDSLDTLYIAGLTDEYNRAIEYIKTMKPFNQTKAYISVFETNIRMVGGFLSAYDLSGEPILLQKAQEMADILLTAFDEEAGVFAGSVSLSGKERGHVYGYVCLAEIGSMQLEMRRLSILTGNPIYDQKVTRIMKLLKKYEPEDGLYGEDFDPASGHLTGALKLGGRADSFYEYLVKQWLLTGKKEKMYLEMYQKSLYGIMTKLVDNFDSNTPPVSFIYSLNYGQKSQSVEHLACFAAGMLALGEMNDVSKLAPSKYHLNTTNVMKVAEQFGTACYLSYHNSVTGIGSESYGYDSKGIIHSNGYYILRPETVESLFYLYRITGNTKYQDYAWEIFQNIEKNCRVENGYSGLNDVNRPRSYNDNQESFFLAETLKYLYLTFSPDYVIPLDKFVFNTEAHPLRTTN